MNKIDLMELIASDDLHLLKKPNESKLAYQFKRLKYYLITKLYKIIS